MSDAPNAPDRRRFIRLDYIAPLAYKICKEETLTRLLQGYTANISEAGILCNIDEKVNVGDVLWLSFDRGTLTICEELERRSLIYQNGVIGKVARLQDNKNGTYNVGIQFITREEKNITSYLP
ncbi:MAG: PilZ domain-containing protein [Candidatus Omnitrophota bacterium]